MPESDVLAIFSCLRDEVEPALLSSKDWIEDSDDGITNSPDPT
jgi:hypothetical protein